MDTSATDGFMEEFIDNEREERQELSAKRELLPRRPGDLIQIWGTGIVWVRVVLLMAQVFWGSSSRQGGDKQWEELRFVVSRSPNKLGISGMSGFSR